MRVGKNVNVGKVGSSDCHEYEHTGADTGDAPGHLVRTNRSSMRGELRQGSRFEKGRLKPTASRFVRAHIASHCVGCGFGGTATRYFEAGWKREDVREAKKDRSPRRAAHLR